MMNMLYQRSVVVTKYFDDWLLKQAINSQSRNNAKVYVITDSETKQVIGYYAIAMGTVQRENALATLRQNSPNPIPMVVLARLAVHKKYHGKGIGVGLLKDSVRLSVHAMNVLGRAAILVHTIDESARRFYRKFGFTESSFEQMTLMASIRDIEKAKN
jgi:GNAT superfamily N-acetyltransferase